MTATNHDGHKLWPWRPLLHYMYKPRPNRPSNSINFL